MEAVKIDMPSGAVLTIGDIPFKDANALNKALLKELKDVTLNTSFQVGDLLKDVFCTGFSSPEIERCLWVCLGRCTYGNGQNDLKITESTFEPLEARADYMKVCMEVAKNVVAPFVKSLYAAYQEALAAMPGSTPQS